MGVPPSLSKLPSPTELFSIYGEVLGHPLDWQGGTAELVLTELLTQETCKPTKSKSSLRPWIRPVKLFVVVNVLTWEGAVIVTPTCMETQANKRALVKISLGEELGGVL